MIVLAADLRAQAATLPMDADYLGAMLDASKPVVLTRSGRVSTATLKRDYVRNGLLFAAGSQVRFYEDGSIWDGTLRSDAAIGNVSVAAGFVRFHQNGRLAQATIKSPLSVANLTVPAALSVAFEPNGTVLWVSSTAGSYSLLGRLVRGQTDLLVDSLTGTYALQKGYFLEPQLIARFMVNASKDGSFTNVPVVAAGGTFFTFNASPNYPRSEQWSPNSFVLNGVTLANPVLFVRDMRISSIRLNADATINGKPYKSGELLWLSDAGTILN